MRATEQARITALAQSQVVTANKILDHISRWTASAVPPFRVPLEQELAEILLMERTLIARMTEPGFPRLPSMPRIETAWLEAKQAELALNYALHGLSLGLREAQAPHFLQRVEAASRTACRQAHELLAAAGGGHIEPVGLSEQADG